MRRAFIGVTLLAIVVAAGAGWLIGGLAGGGSASNPTSIATPASMGASPASLAGTPALAVAAPSIMAGTAAPLATLDSPMSNATPVTAPATPLTVSTPEPSATPSNATPSIPGP